MWSRLHWDIVSLMLDPWWIKHSLSRISSLPTHQTNFWINGGEVATFSKLLPVGCALINAPRSTVLGGGITSILKSSLSYTLLTTASFSSFYMSCFELCQDDPVLCVVIYRPPKLNTEYISDFSEFSALILANYDRIIITGDIYAAILCR